MLTQLTNHTEVALKKLVEQFRRKTKWTALLSAFLKQAQDLEDALWQLFTQRGLDTAIGAQLDVIGRIVGEPRYSSPDDEEYRMRIKARIRVNLSSGTPEDIYAVFYALLGAGTKMRIVPGYPAGFVLKIEQTVTAAQAALFSRFLSAARMAGVYALVEWFESPASGTFCFGATTTLTAGVASGATVLPVKSTAGFPISGTVLVGGPGGSQRNYSSITATSVLLTSTIGTAYGVREQVELYDGTLDNAGLSSTASPAVGGQFARVATA